MAISSIPATPLRLGKRLLSSQLVETIIAPNGVDRYVELLDPLWSVRDVRASIVAVDRQTPRSATLTLRLNDNWPGFEAGQHVGLTVEIDGVLTTRFYSPASSAARQGDTIELTVTAHPGGRVSEHLFANARPGTVVGISPPEGEFVLPAKRPGNLLLISGGSGITPVMSMLRTLCEEGHEGAVTFVHYARGPEDAIYEADLEALAARHPNVKIVHAYTRAAAPKGSLKGRITKAQLKRICPDYANAQTYVCGPNALIAAAERIWESEGIIDLLHSESFVLPEPAVVAEDATGQINFIKSGIAVDNDGTPLLAQAEAAGLTPRCGCRMGICHTCIAHIDEGAVRDVRTGEVRTVNDEFVQICVNAPVGDVEIEL